MSEVPELDTIARVSRELGSDPAFVLHGGGNTSIKGTTADVTGADIDTVWVKGSGWDLATIEPEGFAPLRRRRLLDVLTCEQLTDEQMVNEVKQASLIASAPTASIEALLHAFIPARVVLHSHADAIVALTNQRGDAGTRAQRVIDALGERVLVLPYVMPGFDLAREVASHTAITGGTVDAIVLSNHGLFTFADDADAALRRHRALVERASRALGVETWGRDGEQISRAGSPVNIADFRAKLSAAAGKPMIVCQSDSAQARSFASRSDLEAVTSRGTATPEHVIHTKREPLIGRDVTAYGDRYRTYVAANRGRVSDIVELDPAPRVIFDPEWGMLTAGATVKEAKIASDIAIHTSRIIEAADRMSGYASLDNSASFDIEYWSLEQAKLTRRSRGAFAGEVALVTGAASGIGRACAERLLAEGAAVVGVDLNPDVESMFQTDAWRGVVGDVSDAAVLSTAAEVAARDFGGVDVLIVAAGIFPDASSLSKLDDRTWDAALSVNLTAVARIFREAHPFLARAPRGGRVVLVSTKNVAAPGPGAAAYSASKTGAAQLARVAALEWAADGIRVNQVDPDAVFDTAIWTPERLKERADQYGLTVEEYRTRNLLGVEVTSRKVADAVVALCGVAFSATTGAHVTVDGGNERVI
ncbi:SDR family oxidoreductase [Paramicrobacterium agarici]|uniref:Rhamnose utilization protein RhaD (Predicted bifunctional aldolase and dehydrogenase) n=1 Tax=Paramicrobacterium agarici TaxID=630514 RepID=A0A2A9DUQ5_9MICO|nr:SDR family oxidoreductase [Microbacterium agarici]PFG29885.1 rhamnose utilization protein RhaD (predicted bifunctional aldolase and dehydrogenase) [Microbacterium agarici]